MKIVVDIKGELKKDDILIYDGSNFKGVNKDIFLKETNVRYKELQGKYEELINDFNELKMSVNGKLREYHKILQLLTKEE